MLDSGHYPSRTILHILRRESTSQENCAIGILMILRMRLCAFLRRRQKKQCSSFPHMGIPNSTTCFAHRSEGLIEGLLGNKAKNQLKMNKIKGDRTKVQDIP